jgi:hypothetical protein
MRPTRRDGLQRFAYFTMQRKLDRGAIDDQNAICLAYDNLNRLTSQALAGQWHWWAVLNEPGIVTISGTIANVDANSNFRGTVATAVN